MFKEFYQNNGLKTDTIIVKDGCGVSRNNLMSASWMTDALNKLYKMQDFYKFKEYMAQSGDGTLTNRLYNMRGEAWLKTGSLSNISAIAGYVKSQDGNTYSVAILTQNFIEEQPKIKSFEDEIIEIIYNR
jgi:D-alanyl-D-alanine carboxypeptidase/D-alanyl-D-alanine-endopeptidase (penicillin-binding protein 4)